MPTPTPAPDPTTSTAGGLGGIIDLIRGLTGRDDNVGNTAAGMADPLGKYRSGAADKLNDLINDPGSITSTPWYQAGMDQGTAAINRTEGSKGLLNSGNRGIDLQKFGINYFDQQYEQRFNDLFKVAGAGSPSDAAAAYLKGKGNTNTDIGGGIAGLLKGLGPDGISSIMNMIKQGGSSVLNQFKQAMGLDPNMSDEDVTKAINDMLTGGDNSTPDTTTGEDLTSLFGGGGGDGGETGGWPDIIGGGGP